MDNYELLYGSVKVEIPVRLRDLRIRGNLSVGAFSYFNFGSEVGDCEIGRYCSIGQQAIIAPGEHPLHFLSTHPFASDPSGVSGGFVQNDAYKEITCSEIADPGDDRGLPVKISNDVWIGARAILLRGVTVGDGAVIAANAVVTRNVEPYEIVGGSPARHIRWRFPEDLRRRLLRAEWWKYDLKYLGERRDYSQVILFLDRFERMKEKGSLPLFIPQVQATIAPPVLISE